MKAKKVNDKKEDIEIFSLFTFKCKIYLCLLAEPIRLTNYCTPKKCCPYLYSESKMYIWPTPCERSHQLIQHMQNNEIRIFFFICTWTILNYWHFSWIVKPGIGRSLSQSWCEGRARRGTNPASPAWYLTFKIQIIKWRVRLVYILLPYIYFICSVVSLSTWELLK